MKILRLHSSLRLAPSWLSQQRREQTRPRTTQNFS